MAAPSDEALGEYRRKRDFATTPEPSGRGRRARGAARFVIQEHHARRLHWDLRLERDGVLASWALPRGVPHDPKGNRLAVHTEDHPLEYLTFEGTIPKGEYGAGEMHVWDHGTYDCEKWREDEVIVVLHGERVQGRYALFQTRGDDWMIHRMDPPTDPDRVPVPTDLRPMLATLAHDFPGGGGWAYEIKWDGIRAIGVVEGGRLSLTTRNGNDVTRRYPELRALGPALGSREVVLDGEIVAFDETGRPSFQRLQRRMHVDGESAIRRLSRDAPVVYVIFDLLYLDGRLLLDEPYEDRREALLALGLDGPSWQTPPHETGDGSVTRQLSRQFGLEGVVVKRLDSRYEPGRRSPAWRKIKFRREQELVVGGWMPGQGARAGTIGGLLVGYYDDEGTLHYAGRVGSGFTDTQLVEMLDALEAIEIERNPFGAGKPPTGARYVDPVLVIQVRFSEWTAAGHVRQPVFVGVRDDKDARDVRREDPE